MTRRVVLYLLNISNPDRLTSDSGWIFADLLAPALANAGVEVTVAAPAPVGDARCGFQRTGVPGTKYRARFAPDLDQLAVRRTTPGSAAPYCRHSPPGWPPASGSWSIPRPPPAGRVPPPGT
ncbi:MAG: hypothetical protein ACRDTA_19255 [Pseudonocardiaceae bacterium]